MIQSAVEKVRAFADAHRVEVATVGLPSGITLRGERRQLVRALTNLLDNGVRYSDPDQQIIITLEPRETTVAITVKDEGVGIPRAELERVFERFFSLPRPDTGQKNTGLGLNFAREVAELHNGSLTLENRNPGTRARMRLRHTIST